MCRTRGKEFEVSESHPHIAPGEHVADRSLRAGDRDRDTVADILREQHLAGRLDTDELQERIERCYAAKTYGELDALLAELPVAAPEPPGSAPVGMGDRRHGAGVPTRMGWLPLPALMPLLFVALVVSHGHLIWLFIPLFFFVFVRRRRHWRSTI
jgi:Domain of unknown function (DUF1707)